MFDNIKNYIFKFYNYIQGCNSNKQATWDYVKFKKSISNLVRRKHLSDEAIEREYLYIKACLYNIDTEAFKTNLTALEQEIERIEKK